MLVYWRLVSLPCFLSLGQRQWPISQPPAVSMLWRFADCFSILQGRLTLVVAHWLRRWALWTAVCPISGRGLPLALLPFQSLFTRGSCGDRLHAPPRFSCTLTAPHPLCCVFIFSSLVIVRFFFFFLQGEGSVCPGDYAGLSQGWLWEYCMTPGAHLLDVYQADLELTSGCTGALLFSQCNVVWSFIWARCSGCQSFNSLCFISAKCGSSISARFLIYGAHAVCFCLLVTILDPSLFRNYLCSILSILSFWVFIYTYFRCYHCNHYAAISFLFSIFLSYCSPIWIFSSNLCSS
jgi:hypothetical protein